MTRPSLRRTPNLECLETRKVLSSVGGPSADKQYALELINLIRTNPAAAATRFTSNVDANVEATLDKFHLNLSDLRTKIASAAAKPPLGYSDALDASAQNQSQAQADMGRQTHDGKDGAGINQRIEAAGYGDLASAGENAYAYAESTDAALQAFLFDWGVADNGHFRNLLQPDQTPQDSFSDVGIGLVSTNKNGLGPLVVTQDFATRKADAPQILGVVYQDSDHDNFYTPGEGRGGVTIQATDVNTGQTFSTQTWNSGGYQMPVTPNSTYRVSDIVDGKTVKTQTVQVSDVNQKTDFVLTPSDLAAATPTPPPAPTPPAPVAAPVAAPAPAPVAAPAPMMALKTDGNPPPSLPVPMFDPSAAPTAPQPTWLGKWSQWREIKAS